MATCVMHYFSINRIRDGFEVGCKYHVAMHVWTTLTWQEKLCTWAVNSIVQESIRIGWAKLDEAHFHHKVIG